jgi:hypothetical protein
MGSNLNPIQKFHSTVSELTKKRPEQKRSPLPPSLKTLLRFPKPKPGLLSNKSFNHKNHSADNTPTPTTAHQKSPAFAMGCYFACKLMG